MKQHWDIIIEGLVQGVFFRATAREKAGELGLTGYVENRRNGSVFIEAEGTEENLNKFIEWCHSGPPTANVSEVSYELSEVRDLKDFTIRR